MSPAARHIVSDETKRALLAANGNARRDRMPTRARTLAVLMERHGPRTPRNADGPAVDRAQGAQPRAAFLPPRSRAGSARFGLAAHLYALRRDGDQGIGDFTTSPRRRRPPAGAGGSVVGINPLHALFPADRTRASPYHPSDRRFLDPIYIDVDRVPDLAASDEARTVLAQEGGRIAALAARADVDYDAVWRVKARALDACFACFDLRPPGDPLATEFERFTAAGGAALARFRALRGDRAGHPRVPWPAWPQALREPEASGTAEFARRNARRIRFARTLQWLADRQFACRGARPREGGPRRSVLSRSRVGAAPDGAEVLGAYLRLLPAALDRAPPDPVRDGTARTGTCRRRFRTLCFARGRRWAPRARRGQHAARRALRIDHVSWGSSRLFWIPDGARAVDGAYVRTRWRVAHRPVPRKRFAPAASSSARIWAPCRKAFASGCASRHPCPIACCGSSATERACAPARYPAPIRSPTVSTHDLPTIAGWWAGADIARRRRSA
jgi:glycogen operon protein